MTDTASSDIYNLPREGWPLALLANDRAPVLTCAQQIADCYVVRDNDLPRAGQHPLVLRDSVESLPFQCGDVPMAMARVTLFQDNVNETDSHGITGASIIMRNDAPLARAIAIIDAACSELARSRGIIVEQAEQLIREGHQKLDNQRHADQLLLAATSVDFSLLGSARGAGNAKDSDRPLEDIPQ